MSYKHSAIIKSPAKLSKGTRVRFVRRKTRFLAARWRSRRSRSSKVSASSRRHGRLPR